MEKLRQLLQMKNIAKTFPGVKALDAVSFDLLSGEVHALVGENGAGKTTLVNVLGGVIRPDSGQIIIDGKERTITTPLVARDLGIAFIHQELNLIDELSVMENFFVGNEPLTTRGLVNWTAMYQQSSEILRSLGISLDPRETVGNLPVSLKQMIEIAKALVFEAKIIVMDEPTSSLTDEETKTLFDLIDRLRAGGKGIIYISHRMEEIFQISDRITVLRNGQYIATKPTAKTDHGELVKLMIGSDPGQHFLRSESISKEVLLEVRNLWGPRLVHDVSFQVRAGEILGIAGLVGSGRTELLETIFGVYQPRKGEIYLAGKPFRPKSPRSSLQEGIAYVPEDRESKGLFLDFGVDSNIHLAKLERDAHFGHADPSKATEEVASVVRRLGIVTPSLRQQIRNLSGGNRQKVILARWIYAGMRVLLINEPTRGIDVGAKSEMYQLLRELNQRGVAIVMVSSELPEILSISHRIVVMHEGRVADIFAADQVDREELLRSMTGFNKTSA